MKKVLALLLAVLMLAALAISVSAETKTDRPATLQDLIDALYGESNPYVQARLGAYQTWYDKCPDCGQTALYFVKDGKLYWQCLSAKCLHYGETNYTPSTPVPTTVDSWVNGYYYAQCPDCGHYTAAVYAGSFLQFGQMYDQFTCSNCGHLYRILSNRFNYATLPEDIICEREGCGKRAEFIGYAMVEGHYVARFVCPNHHVTDQAVTSNIGYTGFYVNVICPTTGSYTMTGSAFSAAGEKKTITFKPADGYVLTDVLINGVSQGAKSELEIIVRSNLLIRPVFEKAANTASYNITISQKGLGTITAKKNGKVATADVITVKSSDEVTLWFTPKKPNYFITEVRIDGSSIGRPSAYTFTNVKSDHTVEVVFQWRNPYTDKISDRYLAAVEYVTESDVLIPLEDVGGKTIFAGANKVTKQDFAMALAEMADVTDELNSDADRLAWAKKNGLVGEKETLTDVCTVKSACAMVKAFLLQIAKDNNVTFKGVSAKDSVCDTAVKIGLTTQKIYEKDRQLNRYDLAAVCYLISKLPYSE